MREIDFITEEHIKDGGNEALPEVFVQMFGPRARYGDRFYTYAGTFSDMDSALNAVTQPGLKRSYLPGVAINEDRLYESAQPEIVADKVGTWGEFRGGVPI